MRVVILSTEFMLIPFKELFARHNIQTPGVLHLGANTGQEAQAYEDHHIPRVIWVEALPHIYTQLVTHLKRFPGHIALLACLSDKDNERVGFNIASNGAQSSSFLEFGTHKQEHPTVHFVGRVTMITKRLDTLLTQNKLEVGEDWFLNADLQGAELLALKGMGDLLKKFKYAYIEVNARELYKGCPLVGEIDDYLAGFGLVGVETKMTGSGWGDKLFIRE